MHPVGGIRTFFRYTYSRLPRDKYKFTLIAPDIPEGRLLLEHLREIGVEYIPLRNTTSIGVAARTITWAVGTQRPDLVHSHGFSAAVAATPAVRLLRRPHLVTCHDVFTERQLRGIPGLAKKSAISFALSQSDSIHCVSHDAEANLREHLWLRRASHRTTVIRNGIDSTAFREAETRNLRASLKLADSCFLVGFFGRFMSQKGFRYLVDAVNYLQSVQVPRDVTVLAFGEGCFMREEVERVTALGLAERFRFLPGVPHVASTLKGVDVVAMPSLWEACGLLAMESLVAGVPLIAADCIGLREIVRGTPARIVPSRNASALADAIRAEMVASSRTVAERFAEQAAEQFDVSPAAKALDELMVRLCGGGADVIDAAVSH